MNSFILMKCLQDDPHAYLPRIGASLFMSPGGNKFVQFLFCFSRYVLYRVACNNGLYLTQLPHLYIAVLQYLSDFGT